MRRAMTRRARMIGRFIDAREFRVSLAFAVSLSIMLAEISRARHGRHLANDTGASMSMADAYFSPDRLAF